MADNLEKLTSLEGLQELAKDLKERFPGKSEFDALSGKVDAIKVPTTVAELTDSDEYQKAKDTAAQIAAAVAELDHLEYKIVDSTSQITTSADDADKYIYLVKKTGGDNDSYDEYMVIGGKLEKVGNWDVDLSDYAKAEDVPTIEKSGTNGSIKVDGDDIQVYVHPAATAQASGLYKITVDNTGHVTAATKATKTDITDLGIPDKDTTYEDATQSAHGLMTADDKKKLDSIEIATTADVKAMLAEVFSD